MLELQAKDMRVYFNTGVAPICHGCPCPHIALHRTLHQLAAHARPLGYMPSEAQLQANMQEANTIDYYARQYHCQLHGVTQCGVVHSGSQSSNAGLQAGKRKPFKKTLF